MKFLYHNPEDSESSPFEVQTLRIARQSSVSVACPYLSLSFFRDCIVEVASTWKLVSDIPEWISVTSMKDRPGLEDFIGENYYKIRHQTGLHAKVMIGDRSAMFGSANFTGNGMRKRNEFGVAVDDPKELVVIRDWFKATWDDSKQPSMSTIHTLCKELPEIPDVNKRSLGNSKISTEAVDLDLYRDIRCFSGNSFRARGFYLKDGEQFRVMRGSKIKPSPSNSFYTHADGKNNRTRDKLINEGVIVDYEFVKDHDFPSPSAAASIVAGTPRNGPAAWGTAKSRIE